MLTEGNGGSMALVERALESIRDVLGMDMAYVADVRGGLQDYRIVTGDGASFGAAVGAERPLEGTYCRLMLEGKLASLVPDAVEDPTAGPLAITREGAIGAYLGVPLTLAGGEVYGTFCLLSHAAQPQLGARELRLVETLARFVGEQLDREQAHVEAQRAAVTDGAVRALLVALEARDGYTGEHSRAVVDLALATGRRLGLGEAELADVETAALLHDIGKIGIRDDVLRKPGKLSGAEWAEMRRHPAIGAPIVASMENLAHLEPVIRAEHERWDGRGYPDGLQGGQIPLASRITFACDAYHAMTSDRPYRRALAHEVALEEIRRHVGTQFCPTVGAALLEVLGAGPQPDRIGPSSSRPPA